ncbi:Sec72 ER protein-translocation complex component [Candida orthopsilosis Co 90-125]|uniref:Sec72 ER protein-translocation complex component n=1 Tax=Candida orthopsilosis (strain 90-125) TaxID=1136231 RepID=H8X7P3_CANO9|nr:Sec72 ER protein-translocation complex component [Candida orthopsilosis Co 90-125]CCG23828.1 Sec72 ER protein-translocation complex component [Candida orthopsilosis Co 90-125]
MEGVLYESKAKKLTLDPESTSTSSALKLEIDQLNVIIQELINQGSDVPPVPTQENFNKDLSKMIKKLYDGGVQSFKMGKFEDSVRQFSVGIEMIQRRPKLESFAGTIQELSKFLMSRCDAYLKTKQYLQAYNDVDLLLNMQMNAPDNFLRRGVANYFLGNYELARADYQRGLAFDENHPRLQHELTICLDKILEENGDHL